jgi:N-acetylneuraminate synthase
MPPQRIKIANRVIGEGEPCFIIAEAGVNHNGDVNLAKKLVDAAADAGADAVKFQTFTAETIVTRNAEKAPYQKEVTGTGESQYAMLKKLELSAEAHRELKRYAEKKGIIFLSTPYDSSSVDFLIQLGVVAFKVSSADITNLPLLAHMAARKLPVILSTGMATLEEIEDALATLQKNVGKEVALLHCVFNYPARAEDVNLRVMATLEKAFNLPVGYSDHTMGIEVSLAAVALGARIIEKHFTLDRTLPGPDHRASLEPGELREMVAGIRNVEKALGSPVKRISAAEEQNRLVCRRSIVAASDIPEGTAITGDMLATKRPGTGIAPGNLEKIIGAKATRRIKKDELITWESVR